MANQGNDMHVSKPPFRFEWNLNTIVVLIGFAGGLVAWGYTLSEMKSGQTNNADAIERIEARVIVLEGSTRMLDNHELRISAVESQARNSSEAMRSVEQALSSLAADIRVTREILERIERTQGASIAAR